LLSHYEDDCKSFPSQIITGDKMWIHHFELQTTEWHHPTSPQKKKLKATTSAGKVTVTVLRNAEGVILVVIMAHGHTINSDL